MYLYREDPILTRVAEELNLEVPSYKKKKPQVENAVRKPLNAGLLKEDTDPETLIKAIHELHPDAIITLASSVLTIMQEPSFGQARLNLAGLHELWAHLRSTRKVH